MPPVEARPSPSATPVPQVSLRHAKTCLDNADRKLRRAQGEQADEVFHLLWAAIGHLETAMSADPHR